MKEYEQEDVEALLKRKQDLKAYSQANGGKAMRDDGKGIEIRKRLNHTRVKLKIV